MCTQAVLDSEVRLGGKFGAAHVLGVSYSTFAKGVLVNFLYKVATRCMRDIFDFITWRSTLSYVNFNRLLKGVTCGIPIALRKTPV